MCMDLGTRVYIHLGARTQNPFPKGVRFMQFDELTDSMLMHLIMTEQVLVGKFALTFSC